MTSDAASHRPVGRIGENPASVAGKSSKVKLVAKLRCGLLLVAFFMLLEMPIATV